MPILLELDEVHGTGLTHNQLAHSYAVCPATITNIIKSYVGNGIEDIIRYNISPNSSAALRKVDGRMEARIIQMARRIAKKLEIHYTPKHGSWLDIAEIELNVMTRQCLSRRIENINWLCKELSSWESDRNQHTACIQWQFTTDKARTKLVSLYPKFDVIK